MSKEPAAFLSTAYDFDVYFLLLSSDSERFNRFLALHDALARVGMHTTVATHPDQLYFVMAPRRLRVIVIDGNPRSGLSLYTEITRLSRLKNVMVILLTDAATTGYELAKHAGAYACLPTTASASQLHQVILSLVDRRRAKPLENQPIAATEVVKANVPEPTPRESAEPSSEPSDNNWIWLYRS